MNDLPRICITSGGDEIRLRSYLNHAIYAREHGMDFRLETGIDPEISSKFDYKVSILRRLLPMYDWLVWMDDDTFFTDFEATHIQDLIAEAERDGISLVIAEGPREPNGFWSRINTGVMLIRNDTTGRAIVEQTAAADLAEVRAWWDDERDGLFTNGDQDQMWWVICTQGFQDAVRIVDHRRLNSRGHYYERSLTDAFVMHFTGYPDKEVGIARFADLWDIGQELVPTELLDKYHVRVRDPFTGWERRWREQKGDRVNALKYRLRPHKARIADVVSHLPAPVRARLPFGQG